MLLNIFLIEILFIKSYHLKNLEIKHVGGMG